MCSQAKRFSFNREFKMTYSTDFRRRVIARVQSGNSKSAVCLMFGISRSTLHSWQNRADLSPRHNGLRNRKLNRRDFEQHVMDYPDALQRERAAQLQGKHQFHSARPQADGSDPEKNALS